MNLRSITWILFGRHQPPFTNIFYEKIVLTEDFNAQENDCVFDTFLYQHDLKILAKEGACYKKPRHPSCTDLYLKNSPLNFKNTSSGFIGFSDFHKLVLTVFNLSLPSPSQKTFLQRLQTF